MYITRVWISLADSNQQKLKLSESSESNLQITRYDFGGFVGELIEDSNKPPQWNCWEVLKRVKENGEVMEILKAVPEDWVPFELISCETYPVKLNESGYEMAGWLVKDSGKGEAPSQEPEQKGSEAVLQVEAEAELPREQVRRPKAAAREYMLLQGLRQKKKHTTGKKPNQPSQQPSQTSSNQTSRVQQKEQYPKQWEEPVAQTWTPLAQIVQEAGVASRQPQHRLKQDPSYRRQKDSRSYLPSQLPRQQSSKTHRNPTSHQPNTPL